MVFSRDIMTSLFLDKDIFQALINLIIGIKAIVPRCQPKEIT